MLGLLGQFGNLLEPLRDSGEVFDSLGDSDEPMAGLWSSWEACRRFGNFLAGALILGHCKAVAFL